VSHLLLETSPIFAILAKEVAEDEVRRPLTGLTHAKSLLADAVAHLEYDLAEGKRPDLSCVHRQTLLRIATIAVQALRQFKLETAADAIEQDIPF
jgi:hypothetical protein